MEDKDALCIFELAGLPRADIRKVLEGSGHKIDLREEILETIDRQEETKEILDEVSRWKYTWDDLESEDQALIALEKCNFMQRQVDGMRIDGLKETVLRMGSHSKGAEALLTELVLKLIEMLSFAELTIKRNENRAEICQLHSSVVHHLDQIKIDPDELEDAQGHVEAAGMMLDEIIERSLEPVPESWIDQVEVMEQRVRNLSKQQDDYERMLSERSQKDDGLQSTEEVQIQPTQHHEDEVDVDRSESTMSLDSGTSGPDGYTTDVTEGEDEFVKELTTPRRDENMNDASRLKSLTPSPTPMGTLEMTDAGITADLYRAANVQAQKQAEKYGSRPSSARSSESDSPISTAKLKRASSTGSNSSVMNAESYLLTPNGSSVSERLDPNDPKRISLEVSSLRNALLTRPEDDKTPMTAARTLDLKIQHILTSLPETVDILPMVDEKPKTQQFGTYRLVTTSTASSLSEAGYGQTRRYILHRKNAKPQVIWVRIIAERVMVRVGGGWTDLAEWLANVALHRSGASSSTISPVSSPAASTYGSGSGQRSPAPTNISPSPPARPLSSPVSLATRQDVVDKRLELNRLDVTPTRGDGKRQGTVGRSPPSGYNSSPPGQRALGMSGPSSLLDSAAMTDEKRAWVQHIMGQVESSKKADSNVLG
ncbi:hypothetical protein V1511DRAFT_488422 [Dipodascopsis uninucleata]